MMAAETSERTPGPLVVLDQQPERWPERPLGALEGLERLRRRRPAQTHQHATAAAQLE
jgi:hypothetical protein